MHPLFNQATQLTHDVIGAAIEVHKDKGPGLLESIYEWCLTKENDPRRNIATSSDTYQLQFLRRARWPPHNQYARAPTTIDSVSMADSGVSTGTARGPTAGRPIASRSRIVTIR